MNPADDNTSEDEHAKRAGRTLTKAFAFAGAILGVGAYGLVRTIILFATELNWVEREVNLGNAFWWIGGGAIAGLGAACILIRTRRVDK